MTYQAVDIPFFAGQDTSFDRKVLPVGPLHLAENVFYERTGRYVERRGLTQRPTIAKNDLDVGSYQLVTTLPDDRILASNNAITSAFNYGEGTFGPYISPLDGVVGSWGYAGNYYGHRPESLGGSQNLISPSICVSLEAVVYAYISQSTLGSTGLINVIFYDKATLRVLRTERFNPGSPIPSNLREVKIIGHPGQSNIWLMVRTSAGVTLYRFTMRTGPTLGPTIAPVDTNSTIDGVAGTGGDRFLVAYIDNVGNLKAQARQWVDAADTVTLTQTLTNTGSEPKFVSVAGRTSVAFAAAATWANAGTNYRAQVIRDGGATNGGQTTLGATYVTAPCLSWLPDDTASLSWGEWLPWLSGAPEYWRTSNVQVTKAGGVSGTAAIANSFPVAAPIVPKHPASSTFSDPAFRGHTLVSSLIGAPTALATNNGSFSLAKAQLNDFSEPVPAGVLVRAGGGREDRISTRRAAENVNWSPGHPAEDPGVAWYVPYEVQNERFAGAGTATKIDDTRTLTVGFSVMNHEDSLGSIFGIRWDRDNALTTGSAPLAINDIAAHYVGFNGPPWLIAQEAAVGTTLPAGVYIYQAVMEYTDATGRIWRSAPSEPFSIELSESKDIDVFVTPCAGYPPGSVVTVYRTDRNGSLLYSLQTLRARNNKTKFTDTQTNVSTNGVLIYTTGGVLANDPPPACAYIARTRNRVWCGLLDYPSRIQSSKFTRTTEGIHWSNLDNFFVDLPEKCTGLASMDDTLIAFSEEAIYLVHGEGPNDQGTGNFSEPQTIPTDTGCINARSIVIAGPGVFFQSRLGIELLNRGFSAPVFVGDPVRDQVNAHPICLDAAEFQSDQSVRWLMANSSGARIVLIYDMRIKAWSVLTYTSQYRAMGRVVKPDVSAGILDGMTVYQTLLQDARQEDVTRPETDVVCAWETGELRPAGMLAGALGRRFNILGEYRGPCTVTVRMAFDDKAAWHPTWVKTWTLTDANYSEGDPVTLELTLPKQKFQAVRFRVESQRSAGNTTEGFRANGMTVFFDTEGEGPRVGRGQKG